MSKLLKEKVISLAGRLPYIWEVSATSDAQKRALLPCLVDKVVLERCDLGTHRLARR